MVIIRIGAQEFSPRLVSQHDHVIQAFAQDGADPSLSQRPFFTGSVVRGEHCVDAHARYALTEVLCVDCVEYEQPGERASVLRSETSCVDSTDSLDEMAARRHPTPSPESATNIRRQGGTALLNLRQLMGVSETFFGGDPRIFDRRFQRRLHRCPQLSGFSSEKLF